MDILRRNPATVPHVTVAVTELVAPAGNGMAAGSGAAIDYAAVGDGRGAGTRLFWGPYIALGAGVYAVRFNGGLDGGLAVEFAHDRGNRVLKEENLADFARPLCLVLTRPVEDLEIRALKTPDLRGFSLRSIAIHRLFCAPGG
jgi:hypothetical protein